MKIKLLTLSAFCMACLLLGCSNRKCNPNEFEDHFVINGLGSFSVLQAGNEKVVATNGDTETVRGFDSCAPKQTIYLYQRLRISKDSTIPNGFLKTFYANGRLRSLSHYTHGEETGLEKYYFPNGILERKGLVYNGEVVGPQETYDSSGHLSLVRFQVNNSKSWFIAHYDKQGNIDSMRGWSYCVRGHIKPEMRAGEKFKDILIEVPNLKGVSAVLNISIHDKNGIIFDTSFVKFYKMYNSNFISLDYRFKPGVRGKNKLKIVASLFDSTSHELIKRDSFSKIIFVQ